MAWSEELNPNLADQICLSNPLTVASHVSQYILCDWIEYLSMQLTNWMVNTETYSYNSYNNQMKICRQVAHNKGEFEE